VDNAAKTCPRYFFGCELYNHGCHRDPYKVNWDLSRLPLELSLFSKDASSSMSVQGEPPGEWVVSFCSSGGGQLSRRFRSLESIGGLGYLGVSC
jgi:hypothetical protein